MSLEFLDALEARVRDAAERIEELTAENVRLRREVERLERDREAGRATGEADWAAQRAEVRRRLEAVVDRLSRLLQA